MKKNKCIGPRTESKRTLAMSGHCWWWHYYHHATGDLSVSLLPKCDGTDTQTDRRRDTRSTHYAIDVVSVWAFYVAHAQIALSTALVRPHVPQSSIHVGLLASVFVQEDIPTAWKSKRRGYRQRRWFFLRILGTWNNVQTCLNASLHATVGSGPGPGPKGPQRSTPLIIYWSFNATADTTRAEQVRYHL